MAWIKTILSELIALFVDDGSFAVAIILWLGVVGFLFPRFGLQAKWIPVIFFVGLILILAENVVRGSAKSRKS